MIALIRSFSRASTSSIGNFWSDLTKSTLYVLLPLSIIFAVGLMSQGVPQNFTNYATVQVLIHKPSAKLLMAKQLAK